MRKKIWNDGKNLIAFYDADKKRIKAYWYVAGSQTKEIEEKDLDEEKVLKTLKLMKSKLRKKILLSWKFWLSFGIIIGLWESCKWLILLLIF